MAWADQAEFVGADPTLVARVRRFAFEMKDWRAKQGGEPKAPDVPEGSLR